MNGEVNESRKCYEALEAAAPGKTGLLVEDDPTDSELQRRKLEARGWVIVSVSSGEAALEAIQRNRYDAIFLDLKLEGGMSGLDVLAKLREANDQTKVVVVTGLADPPAIEGVFGVLRKTP